MGQDVSTAVKSIDGNSDTGKQVQDHLQRVYGRCETRNDAALDWTTSEAIKKSARNAKVVLRNQTILANAIADDQPAMIEGIRRAVGVIIQGQILDGVTDIICADIDDILLYPKSSRSTYTLIATDLGSVAQLDINISSFKRRLIPEEGNYTNMIVVTSIISTIDPMALTLEDIYNIVEASYCNSDDETMESIFDLVWAAWENDRKLRISGGVLSDEDRARFDALRRVSIYDLR